MSSSPALVAAGAIVDDLARPTRLLAARRSAPAALAGGWEFAGGKVEPGEEPQQAVHRELNEELGIRVRLGVEIVAAGDGPWPILHDLSMRIWFAQITHGRPAPLADHDLLRWLPISRLRSLDWLAPDLPIVDAIADHARAASPQGAAGANNSTTA